MVFETDEEDGDDDERGSDQVKDADDEFREVHRWL